MDKLIEIRDMLLLSPSLSLIEIFSLLAQDNVECRMMVMICAPRTATLNRSFFTEKAEVRRLGHQSNPTSPPPRLF